MALEQSGYTIIECNVKGAKQAARAALAPIAHLLKIKPAALFQEWMSKATTDLSEALGIQGMRCVDRVFLRPLARKRKRDAREE